MSENVMGRERQVTLKRVSVWLVRVSAALLFITGFDPHLVADVTQTTLVFPHVVHGTLGFYQQTTVTVFNPGVNSVSVSIYSEGLTPIPANSVQLSPGQSVQFEFDNEPFQVGWLSFRSDAAIVATGNIQIRPSRESEELLGEVSLLAQEPLSKAIVPVFLNHRVAQNTAIALRAFTGVGITITLYDVDGREIAQKVHPLGLYGPPPPLALYLTELFPNLPPDFSTGHLVFEALPLSRDDPLAFTFSVLPFYTRGVSIRAGTVAPEDIPVQMIVRLKAPTDLVKESEDIARQYGFRLVSTFSGEYLLGLIPIQVARIVARDSRVALVEPNYIFYLQ